MELKNRVTRPKMTRTKSSIAPSASTKGNRGSPKLPVKIAQKHDHSLKLIALWGCLGIYLFAIAGAVYAMHLGTYLWTGLPLTATGMVSVILWPVFKYRNKKK